jgi:hypothetical protein|tara:strand:+ start:2702 stop:3676 length:975 start_codon:yes stop_codon:yes gene_type:complete
MKFFFINIISESKNLIKNKLRLLENERELGPSLAKPSEFFYTGPDEYEGINEEMTYGNRTPQKATKADLIRTQEKVELARAFIARQSPKDQEEYWTKITTNKYEQGFIASAVVNTRGDVQIRTYNAAAADVRQNQYGVRGEDEKHMPLLVSAHPGIDHPNSSDRSGYAKTRGGINNPTRVHDESGSPASDAQIKAYAYYGEVIVDFVKNKMMGLDSYTDGSGAEIANQMDPKEKILKLNKDLKQQLKKNVIPPTEWRAFLNALNKLGIDLQNIDFTKDLATKEQWAQAIKLAGLKPTQGPIDNDVAYREKLAAMDKLKNKHRNR